MRFFPKRDDRELINLTLRFAAGSVFLWFGADMFVHPEAWYGWVPGWVWPLIPEDGMDGLLYVVGITEFAIGACLASGKWLRESALVAFALVLAATVGIGVTEVTLRDLAVMGICLALAIEADGTAKKRFPQGWFAVLVGLYMLYLFLYGVLYLKAPAL